MGIAEKKEKRDFRECTEQEVPKDIREKMERKAKLESWGILDMLEFR